MIKTPSCRADHQYTEAVDGYTKAIALNPTNAVYFANRAAAHIHLENFGCALTDASKAIELDPKYTKVSLSSDIRTAVVPPNTQAGKWPEQRKRCHPDSRPVCLDDETALIRQIGIWPEQRKRCRPNSRPVPELCSDAKAALIRQLGIGPEQRKKCRLDRHPVPPLWSGLEGSFMSRPEGPDRQVI